MIEIKDLLIIVGNRFLKEEIKKETIRDVISRVINVEIKKEEIKIKNGTVYLDLKPIYKSEIFLKKEKIFEEIEKKLGKKSPQKIM